MAQLSEWTYRDHAAGYPAGDHDSALEQVRTRALRNVPGATFDVLSERRTATGWSFEVQRRRIGEPGSQYCQVRDENDVRCSGHREHPSPHRFPAWMADR